LRPPGSRTWRVGGRPGAAEAAGAPAGEVAEGAEQTGAEEEEGVEPTGAEEEGADCTGAMKEEGEEGTGAKEEEEEGVGEEAAVTRGATSQAQIEDGEERNKYDICEFLHPSFLRESPGCERFVTFFMLEIYPY